MVPERRNSIVTVMFEPHNKKYMPDESGMYLKKRVSAEFNAKRPALVSLQLSLPKI